jgi:tellurium resistance protein TerD
MAISLQKGGNVNLSKTDPSLKQVLLGLGWDTRSSDGADFDLDASIFMVTDSGRVRTDNDFIFYGQLRSSCGSVEHTGDNRTGEGDGDDEALKIKLDQVPTAIVRLVVAATIHEAQARKQNFGMVHNAFIRLVNSETNVEITRFDLSEDSSTETAMVFGEVYRYGGEWKFKAVGQGYAGGLRALAIQHGVDVQ